MADKPLPTLLRYLRRLARPAGGGLSDGQLLERFVRDRDEAAFELLVWRHGPMVLNVCRRLLPAADAEDAFQATFLVFVRKAHAVRQREGLAGWLYRVAYRVALRARGGAAKRARYEKPGVDLDTVPGPAEAGWSDLRPVLDEEISRLPERYRVPVVLCYLEGRTNQEAAAHLGCAEGTVASRLARARERLRARLTRRGLLLGAGALGVALTGEVSAGVPPALVETTLRAAAGLASPRAAALAEGVMRTMLLTKVRIAVVVLLLAGAAGIGGGGLVYYGQAAEEPQGPPALPSADPAQARKRPVAKEGDTLKNTLVALEKALNAAAANQDVETFGKFLADDYVGFSGQHRYTKEDNLRGVEWARNGIDFKMTDVELFRLNDKAAVLSYKGQWNVVSKAGEVLLRRNRRVSNCWVQRGGGWVIAFSQDMVIGPE
jgi:RNA polymerase sigma factor (sigma-70 family)